MKKGIYIFSILFSLLYKIGIGQDSQFSQIYALPLYLNPAYTGNTETHRAALKYRNQWPGVNKAFNSMVASYDFNNIKRKSGFGLMYARDKAGLTGMTLNNIRLLYSYSLKITRDQTIRLGLNVDYSRKEIDISKLVFNDQLYTQSSTSYEQIYNGTINYFDGGVGAIYSYDKIWAGLSVNHLNRPSTSTIDRQARLPVYWHANAGIKIVKNKEYNKHTKYGIVWASYRHQAKFNQIDVGANYIIHDLTVGMLYRGVPIQKKKEFVDRNDALAFTVGYNIVNMNMRFGYSYDLTVSRLASKSSGSHEVSLIFEVKGDDSPYRHKVKIVCPEF